MPYASLINQQIQYIWAMSSDALACVMVNCSCLLLCMLSPAALISPTHKKCLWKVSPLFFVPDCKKAERTPRSERKRRDSFGMFDGYDSCSEESTSSSSSEDSEDEVVPSIPASLPIIKNNGQVYTYPDGKAGMGERLNVAGNFCFL